MTQKKNLVVGRKKFSRALIAISIKKGGNGSVARFMTPETYMRGEEIEGQRDVLCAVGLPSSVVAAQKGNKVKTLSQTRISKTFKVKCVFLIVYL